MKPGLDGRVDTGRRFGSSPLFRANRQNPLILLASTPSPAELITDAVQRATEAERLRLSVGREHVGVDAGALSDGRAVISADPFGGANRSG